MKPGARQFMIDYRLQQADDSIQESQTLIAAKLYRGAINRAYYAMFYAVQALMIQRKVRTSKHQGAIATFDLEFIKSGTIKHEYSKWLHDAFDLRMEVDYGDLAQPDEEKASMTLNHASEFFGHIKKYLAELGPAE